MPAYYFTYGSNHLDKYGNSLGNSYTPIEAEDVCVARDMMFHARGPKFCTHYDTEEAAGVDRFGLVETSLEDVTIVDHSKELAVDAFLKGTRDSLSRQRDAIIDRIVKLDSLRNIMLRLPVELIPKCVEYNGTLDLESLTRQQSILAIDSLEAGRWEKSVNVSNPGTIDYSTEIDGIKVRLWGAAPPDTCRWVEYEEVIPEQRVTKRKMICGPEGKAPEIEAPAAEPEEVLF